MPILIVSSVVDDDLARVAEIIILILIGGAGRVYEPVVGATIFAAVEFFSAD